MALTSFRSVPWYFLIAMVPLHRRPTSASATASLLGFMEKNVRSNPIAAICRKKIPIAVGLSGEITMLVQTRRLACAPVSTSIVSTNICLPVLAILDSALNTTKSYVPAGSTSNEVDSPAVSIMSVQLTALGVVTCGSLRLSCG